MSNRGLIVLVLLGIASLGAGWYFGPGQSQSLAQPSEAGQLAFPGLVEKLAQAQKIEIVRQGKTLAIERRGKGAGWGLADRDLYPIQTPVLRAILTGLTELRLMEPRTSDPGKFARLGVENPDTPKGTSILLRVLDADGKPLAALVLGHRRVRTRGDVPESIYVRRPDETRSWLAEGKLDVSADRQSWIDRDIISIAAARIVEVSVTRGAGHLAFVRDGDKLVLRAPTEHPPLEPYKLEDVGRALDGLTLLDVRRAQGPATVPELGRSVFTAIDGLTVRVTLLKDGKDLWARFAVSGPDAIRADVQALSAKLSGWEYQLSSWKQAALLPTLDDLKAEPAKDGAAPPALSAPVIKP